MPDNDKVPFKACREVLVALMVPEPLRDFLPRVALAQHLEDLPDLLAMILVDAAFDRMLREAGAIDILVNNVWGGYENMIENGEFTWGLPFWKQSLKRWDSMFAAGVRASYVASCHAARVMAPARRGLIVNISFWAAQKYVANVAYGVAKAATDKMTADMSRELLKHDVAVVSLYPGLVRTEKVMEAAAYLNLSNSESPRTSRRCRTRWRCRRPRGRRPASSRRAPPCGRRAGC